MPHVASPWLAIMCFSWALQLEIYQPQSSWLNFLDCLHFLSGVSVFIVVLSFCCFICSHLSSFFAGDHWFSISFFKEHFRVPNFLKCCFCVVFSLFTSTCFKCAFDFTWPAQVICRLFNTFHTFRHLCVVDSEQKAVELMTSRCERTPTDARTCSPALSNTRQFRPESGDNGPSRISPGPAPSTVCGSHTKWKSTNPALIADLETQVQGHSL